MRIIVEPPRYNYLGLSIYVRYTICCPYAHIHIRMHTPPAHSPHTHHLHAIHSPLAHIHTHLFGYKAHRDRCHSCMVVSMTMDLFLVIMDGTYNLDRNLAVCMNMNRIEWSTCCFSAWIFGRRGRNGRTQMTKKVECSGTDLSNIWSIWEIMATPHTKEDDEPHWGMENHFKLSIQQTPRLVPNLQLHG